MKRAPFSDTPRNAFDAPFSLWSDLSPRRPPATDDFLPEAPAGAERDRLCLDTLKLSPLIVWTADRQGALVEIDERALGRFGLTYDQAKGNGYLSVVHPRDRRHLARAWRMAADLGLPIDRDVEMCLRDGTCHWHRLRAAPLRDANGQILFWYGTIEDIHDRKRADDALRWTTSHDGLTGLYNRPHFQHRLHQALAWSERHESQVALLLLDIDNFKSINDQFGHDVGDAFLREIAVRLSSITDRPVMAGRLGEDEFGLCLALAYGGELDGVIDRARATLEQPVRYDDQSHDCRVSIGVSVYPAHGIDGGTLIRNAELALQEAKARGGGLCHFESNMRAKMQVRLSMLSVARGVLAGDRFVPYYQPKIDLGSGRAVGLEALLRWWHHDGEIRYPSAIAAAFDDADIALAIGDRMLAKVAADIATWRAGGVAFGRVAINVTSAEFRQRNFADSLLRRLDHYRIPPQMIELEVTESVLFDPEMERTVQTLQVLGTAGITIALDDFGTGYASMAHLREFPVNALKIDKSFVQQLPHGCNGAIVKALIFLGRGLDIETVAEGIENEVQAKHLRDEGCRIGQGFLFSEGVPAAAVPALMQRVWPVPVERRVADRRAPRG